MNIYKLFIGKWKYKLIKFILFLFFLLNLSANVYYYMTHDEIYTHNGNEYIEINTFEEYKKNLKWLEQEYDEINRNNDYDLLSNDNSLNKNEGKNDYQLYKNRTLLENSKLNFEDIDRTNIINRFLNDYLKNLNQNPRIDLVKVKDILGEFMKYENNEIEKSDIEFNKINKKLEDKLTIHFRYTSIYRIDVSCYWHRAIDMIPKYEFTYKGRQRRLSGKSIFCSKYKLVKHFVDINFDKSTNIINKINSLIKSKNITPYNNIYLKELPIEPLIKGGAWFATFDYIQYSKENSLKEKSIFEYSTLNSCIPKERIAIIVPIKNREHNLNVFLAYIHFFLQTQLKSYKIYVVEQSNEKYDIPFNKGRLYNAAFKQIMKDTEWEFNCVILHDVDLLPITLDLDYGCSDMPKHFSINIKRLKDNTTSPHYKFLTGGVLAIRPHHYELLNGYSNEYFGWGGEDDDFTIRLIEKELCVMRPVKNISNFVMLQHDSGIPGPKRWELIMGASGRIDNDGLSNIEKLVKIKSVIEYPKFTRILVDLSQK